MLGLALSLEPTMKLIAEPLKFTDRPGRSISLAAMRSTTSMLTDRPKLTDYRVQLLGLAAVRSMTSASKASIYAWMQDGTFPKPRKLGNRRVAWLASEVEAWISDLKIAD